MISPDPAARADAVVDEAAARLFSIIESSYESVALLLQQVEQTARGADSRTHEALGPVSYKRDRLRFHLTTSRRRLGELRALRGFLDDENERDHGRPGQRQAA